jgi:NAD-dependent dihydropyrimidine dehydrogenase PreA subunit
MRLTYLKNVTTLHYNSEKCTGCGMCTQVCPHRVFEMNGSRAYITDRDRCIECGACMRNCPSGALSVRPGVGCAVAILLSAFKREKPSCGCGGSCDSGSNGCS